MSADKKADVRRYMDRFVETIDSLSLTLRLAMQALSKTDKAAHVRYDDYVAKYAETKEENGRRLIRIRSHDYCDGYAKLDRELDRIHAGFDVVPRCFLAALVSQYDAYLGNLVKALFRLKPEMLKASERSLTFSQLSEFSDFDAAKEFILEKEVEGLLRLSHVEQFEWLERRFDLKLRVDLPAWPVFVEVTERRNLCVHTDAVVSSQYIKACRDHGVDVKDLKQGDQLEVSWDYFRDAHRCIFEIGVKLGQVLWRKVAPSESAAADKALLDVCYPLLRDNRLKMAEVLLDFADTTLQKRHSSEWFRLTFLIDRVLARYLAGKKKECAELLGTQDWSASSSEFQLAHAVLNEKFDDAARVMRRIGASKYPHKADYLHWPLFAEFRKTAQFAAAFKEIFGDETHEEEVPKKEPAHAAEAKEEALKEETPKGDAKDTVH